jgi:hypothetical protein
MEQGDLLRHGYLKGNAGLLRPFDPAAPLIQHGGRTMDAKWIIAAVVAAVPVMLAAGCSTAMERPEGPIAGTVVGYAEPTVGPVDAGRIMVSIDGKEKSLSSLFSDATLLILSDEPCVANRGMIVASSNWLDSNVAVVEVSTAPGSCDKERQCVFARGDYGKRIVGLCDTQDVIRKAFDVHPETTILVLDSAGRVSDYGTLADYDSLRLKAENLARSTVIEREPWEKY